MPAHDAQHKKKGNKTTRVLNVINSNQHIDPTGLTKHFHRQNNLLLWQVLHYLPWSYLTDTVS